MLKVFPIRAFKDNYIWLVVNSTNMHGFIVDPGDAQPVLKELKKLKVELIGILITHHHADHSAGIHEMLQYAPSVTVWGPAGETISGVTHRVVDQDEIAWPSMQISLNVLDIPGHTAGHIAYYGHGKLFCGDTLFTAGCGRLFEGTPEQMYQSLSKLADLPDSTLVYCGHEYTLTNLRFAQLLEPSNSVIQQRIQQCQYLLQQNLPTVPATLREEKASNPFLRCHVPEVIQAAENYAGEKLNTPVEVFACLRQWKNHF